MAIRGTAPAISAPSTQVRHPGRPGQNKEPLTDLGKNSDRTEACDRGPTAIGPMSVLRTASSSIRSAARRIDQDQRKRLSNGRVCRRIKYGLKQSGFAVNAWCRALGLDASIRWARCPGCLGLRAICQIGCASCGWRLRRRVSSWTFWLLRSKWACSGCAARMPTRLPSWSIWP